jgi:hypothetical protein
LRDNPKAVAAPLVAWLELKSAYLGDSDKTHKL